MYFGFPWIGPQELRSVHRFRRLRDCQVESMAQKRFGELPLVLEQAGLFFRFRVVISVVICMLKNGDFTDGN